MSSLMKNMQKLGLVSQIIIGIILGCLLAVIAPDVAKSFAMLGSLFVSGLKAVAPILVFVLVISSIANQKANIMQISHHRHFTQNDLGEAEVEFTLETKGHQHVQEIRKSLVASGFIVHQQK